MLRSIHTFPMASYSGVIPILPEKLFLLRSKPSKFMYCVPIHTPGKPLFVRANILILPSLYILTCVCFVRANLNKFSINSDYHTYSTCSRKNIHPNHYSSSLCLKDPYHSASVLFNRILNPKWNQRYQFSCSILNEGQSIPSQKVLLKRQWLLGRLSNM